MNLNDTDKKLLLLLREHARRPISEISRIIGLSRTTVQARVERLERQGVIEGYTLRYGQAYVAKQVKAHVMIKLSPKSSQMVESELKKIAELEAIYAISGSFDMIAMVCGDSLDSLNLSIDRIGLIAGVERTESSIILATKLQR